MITLHFPLKWLSFTLRFPSQDETGPASKLPGKSVNCRSVFNIRFSQLYHQFLGGSFPLTFFFCVCLRNYMTIYSNDI